MNVLLLLLLLLLIGRGELNLAEFEKFMRVLRRNTNAGNREVDRLHDYKSSGTYRYSIVNISLRYVLDNN